MTINVKNIGFSHPRTTSKGYNVLVNYSKSPGVTIETGEVVCPYGVDKNGNDVSIKLIPNKTLCETLTSIDELNVELPDRFGWFDETIEPFYFTPYTNGNLRVKIPLSRAGTCDIDITSSTNGGGDLCTIGDIKPGTKLNCTLEWKNVWIIDETFGYFWTVKQIEIIENS